MKKISIALILIVLMIMPGCSEDDITVGFSAGLTGKLSELGVDARNGFLLKVDEINQSGGINGRKIVVDVQDDKNDPNEIPRVYQYYRENNIEFVFGHIISALAVNLIEEAAKEDILILNGTIATDKIDDIDDYFIRTAVSNKFQSIKMAEALLEDAQESVVVIYDNRNLDYTKEFSDGVATLLPNSDITLLEYHPDEAADVHKKIEMINPEAVVMVTPALDTASICQNLRKDGYEGDFYTVSWSMSNDLLTNGGQAVEGIIIVYQSSSPPDDDSYKAYQENFKETYGYDSTFVADVYYELAQIVFEKMGTLDEVTPEALKESLENTNIEGIYKVITLNGSGDAVGAYDLFIVENGEFKLK